MVANPRPTNTQNQNLIRSYTTGPNKLIVKVYFWDPDHAFINLPPVFVQELFIEEQVTAEIVTTPDGRKGILIFKDIKNRIGRQQLFQEADDQDYDE